MCIDLSLLRWRRSAFFTIQLAYKYHKLWEAIPLTSHTPIIGGTFPGIAAHSGVLLFVYMSVHGGGCLSCRSLFVTVWFRRLLQVHLRHNYDVRLYRCHGSPAMSATLQSLSTVHSQQQECTPDRQECTVDSEASEAWQTFPVNNVLQFRLSLEWIVDY